MTWVLIVWCAAIIAWAVAAAGSDTHAGCQNSIYLSAKACANAQDAGTGIGIAIVLLIGFVGFVFFALIWFMTRPRGRRECPACGEAANKGVTVCKSCGHDFAAAARPQTVAPAST
jgi:heme/copper-type cytochrome/quinol oxidase subunit 2